MKLPFASAPNNLCLMRLSAVGDVCHTLAIVRSIQDQWPETQLTWIIGKLEATLVDDIPNIEFIVFDKSTGLKAFSTLRSKMQGRYFDALLHMQVSLRASIASRLVPTNIRVGFDKSRARDFQWLFTNYQIKAQPKQHVLDGLFEFANAIGINGSHQQGTKHRKDSNTLRWDIPIPDAASKYANDHTSKLTPFAVISPCSSARFRNWRNWSIEGYATICDYLKNKYGIHTVLTGGPSSLEREYGDNITRLCQHKPLNLIGKTNLKQLLAIINQARFVISPDSGPAHMATTVSTPVIGLYVTSNPLRTGPYLSQQWVVNKYPEAIQQEFGISADNVNWGQRVRSPHAMTLIKVDDVVKKIDELLATVPEI